ncbi:uncharacterized protein LOC124408375 [Diprion similis]|uniref:uncharacterized protein LOC124408375 n=1 Tax=Diprion similis TaxID=362088 RepID=UPI001EF81376|nr:uncharacterized protein LOC124408375 [Diprion similis]
MLFELEKLLFFWILIQETIVAGSFSGELTDLGPSTTKHNLTNYQFSNCSLYTIAYGSSCTCFECDTGQCTICCTSPGSPGVTCCYCHACLTSCWNTEWQMISFAQVGLSTALLIATVVTIALFFRICNSGMQFGAARRSPNAVVRNSAGRISISSIQQYVIQRLQDRPPRYNDLSDAPPVYGTDPANRVATSEAPPRYTRRAEPAESVNNATPTTESSTQSNTNDSQLPAAINHI